MNEEKINPKVQESIIEMEKVLDKKAEEYEKTSQHYKRVRSILCKYRKRKPRTLREIRELMSLLCFNNIGFCCGPDKDCFYRDAVLEVLGIELKEYARNKATFGFSLAGLTMKNTEKGETGEDDDE